MRGGQRGRHAHQLGHSSQGARLVVFDEYNIYRNDMRWMEQWCKNAKFGTEKTDFNLPLH
jgi:hypothetical protein